MYRYILPILILAMMFTFTREVMANTHIPTMKVSVLNDKTGRAYMEPDQCFKGKSAKVEIKNSTPSKQVVYLPTSTKPITISPSKTYTVTLKAYTLSDGTDSGIMIAMLNPPAGVYLYNDCYACGKLSCG
jgi:hypothetical protein